jgi:hypothetical protein
MANTDVSQIIATSLRDRSGALADNITNNNALLRKINQSGNRKPFAGRDIVLELHYADNNSVQMYSDYDQISTTPADVISAAVYPVKQLAGSMTISGLEQIKNSGKAAVIDLVEAKMENLELSLQNELAAQLYKDGSVANDLNGLQNLVQDDPTSSESVGGINQATYTFWANKIYDFSGAGVTASSTTIQAAMNNVWLQCSRGADMPDCIVADSTYYNHYWTSLQAIQRIMSDDSGASGFTSLAYLNAPVYYDSNAPAAHMYMLNSKYLQLRYHPDTNFKALEPRYAYGQDAMSTIVVWAGNLVCSNRSLQGLVLA